MDTLLDLISALWAPATAAAALLIMVGERRKTMDHHDEMLSRLESTLSKVDHSVNRLNVTVARLEVRVDNIERHAG